MRAPAKTAGFGLGLLSLVFLAAAVYQTFGLYRMVVFSESATATVLNSRVASFHDDDGFLRFRINADLQYRSSSGEQQTAADSDFTSRNYASVRFRHDQLARSPAVKVYYDPSKPASVRFGAELSSEYLGSTRYLYLAFLGTAVLAAVLWFRSQAPLLCANCRKNLKDHHKYCPFLRSNRFTRRASDIQ